jgi:hypothetical protein
MASKRGIRRRRCTGKKRYETAWHAAFDAAALRRKERGTSEPIAVRTAAASTSGTCRG